MVSFFHLTGCSYRFVTMSVPRFATLPLPVLTAVAGTGTLVVIDHCNHHIGVLSCHLCRLHIGSSLLSLSSLSPAHWQLVDHILDHLGPTDSPPSGESQQPHVSNGIGCKQQQQIIDESTPALNNRMCCQQHQLIVICIILYD